MRMYTSKQQSRLVSKIPIGIKFDAWPKSDHGNRYMSPHLVGNRQYIYNSLILTAKKGMTACQI